ncbi:YfcC family protein [Duganella sp. FT50W]|uniref:YfcC family protein n=1 Tax=Duganella lactea TaxID=2692173 RepID=A0A6L8MN48_9BURK|nr:YfcC family protein [Duganella lactea]MYM84313.1 YfcC family protein [Duganella lactea]
MKEDTLHASPTSAESVKLAPVAAPVIGRRWALDPVMMFAALAIAVLLTWVLPSGQYERRGGSETALVVPGTYRAIPKLVDASALAPQAQTATQAAPLSPAAIFTAVPAGLVKLANLIFMVLLGGMLGVFRSTGAFDAGIERLLGLTGGRVMVLTPIVMIILSAGSTFLGMITEYLIVIPLVIAIAERLGMSRLFGFTLLTLAAKVGYLASVTNPLALLIAQPIVGVPVFSGALVRFTLWAIFLLLAIGFVLRMEPRPRKVAPLVSRPLSTSHFIIIAIVCGALAILGYGSTVLGWRDSQFATLYVVTALCVGLAARMPAREGAHAFVEGMNSMMLAALLLGMARGVEIVLREGRILDTIIAFASDQVAHLAPVVVAPIIMGLEMVLTLLIPSTSAKAALSIPILGPIGASVGVSGQTTVLAFILGNGLVNMFSPTSGMLLAFLAAGGIPYGRWFRLILPLFALYTVIATAAVMLAVMLHY